MQPPVMSAMAVAEWVSLSGTMSATWWVHRSRLGPWARVVSSQRSEVTLSTYAVAGVRSGLTVWFVSYQAKGSLGGVVARYSSSGVEVAGFVCRSPSSS